MTDPSTVEATVDREPRIARRSRAAGLATGPIVFLAIVAAPMPSLSPGAHALLGVFAWVIVYWLTEALPIPVTALLGSALAIVLGIAPARDVLAPYGDPIIFLFVGSFILAEAMRTTGLDRRFAVALLGIPAASRTFSRLLLAVGVATCGLSLWVSNTATTAIMLPVGLGVLRALGGADALGTRYPTGFLLMLTWSSSVAVGVPVGSPPNLIAIGMLRDLAGTTITFFDWMAVTMPLTLVMLLLSWTLLCWRYPARAQTPSELRTWLDRERSRLGPWTRGQRNVLAVFVLACTGWIAPGAVAAIVGSDAAIPRFLEQHMPESAVGLLAAILLFALPTDLRRGQFTIAWKDAARIDWGTILLFGGGLALGKLMFDTGLAEAIGRGLIGVAGVEGVWTLTAGSILAGLILSEISSNTTSTTMVVPVVIAIAQAGDVSPVPPVLGAALGASFGFMLPVSTPPNAIVYGSGLVPLKEMVRSGIYLDLAGAVLIWGGLRVLCPLAGLV